ncbi:MAG: hypothetical protein NDJ18_05935 [candidate division Zixibacteria bacterium]|nr:hypothetical protein [candidate division Zixibacteria bacterium]
MSQNAISQLERDLIKTLNEEYSFYQSLYILLDKQRDLIKYNKEEHLLDLFTEIERCHVRIRESEGKVATLRDRQPAAFRIAAVHPEVKKLVNCIVTLVKKNISLVQENEGYARERHDRIKQELENLKNSGKILNYLQEHDPIPQFVNGKQ